MAKAKLLDEVPPRFLELLAVEQDIQGMESDPMMSLCDWDDEQLDRLFEGVSAQYDAVLLQKDHLEREEWGCRCDLYLLRR